MEVTQTTSKMQRVQNKAARIMTKTRLSDKKNSMSYQFSVDDVSVHNQAKNTMS